MSGQVPDNRTEFIPGIVVPEIVMPEIGMRETAVPETGVPETGVPETGVTVKDSPGSRHAAPPGCGGISVTGTAGRAGQPEWPVWVPLPPWFLSPPSFFGNCNVRRPSPAGRAQDSRQRPPRSRPVRVEGGPETEARIKIPIATGANSIAAEAPDGAVFLAQVAEAGTTVVWVVDGNRPAAVAEHVSGAVQALAADSENLYVATYQNLLVFDRHSGDEIGHWPVPKTYRANASDAATFIRFSFERHGGNAGDAQQQRRYLSSQYRFDLRPAHGRCRYQRGVRP